MKITRFIPTPDGGSQFIDIDIAIDNASTDAFGHLIHRSGIFPAQSTMMTEMPEGMNLWEMMKIIDGHNGGRLGLAEKSRYNWRIMMVAGMWFQDLFNYDFRRTEMCIIPYATQVGEVSFCAYNTGVGWRQIVEKMFSSHSTSQWFKEKGRHPIYAAGKHVPLGPEQETAAAMPPLHAAAVEPASCGTGCGCH